MRNGLRASLAILTAAVTVLVLVVAPAAAAGQTQLEGAGVSTSPITDCTDPYPSADPYAPIRLTGSLDGCWYTTKYEVRQSLPNGVYLETGEETFVGCLSRTTICGTFSTEYHFEARFAPDGSEIRGHCEHALVSGTGGFEGIQGIIFFTDDVVNPGNFSYHGHLMMQ